MSIPIFLLCIVSLTGLVSGSCLCPRPWIHYERHCYWFVGKPNTFFPAEAFCNEKSDEFGESHLVSIHDDEERLFVAENCLRLWETAAIWIGLNDIEEEGNFVWTDGSPVNFTNFNKNEPNNVNGVEHCIHLVESTKYGIWNDGPCTTNLYFFVCKKAGWEWWRYCTT
ncbi:Low affinity immunoglobulin epsilon Fc receptor [Holothuria leucospilota]|uniref:Low affinity immunoglobulin epsilon Fc receptor n=1 Tax=Holothuria leucospilota TaxID=206669 RepID=A0A9Q1CHU5_HOLLE|nr:Low affinity immunoglobulin epsilon Fc receptor [Holothuria leucospilota]